MITFPFFCPACLQDSEAEADPIALVFGGAGDLKLKCKNCGVIHRASVQYGAVGQTLTLKGTLTPEDDGGTDASD